MAMQVPNNGEINQENKINCYDHNPNVKNIMGLN